MANEAEVNVKNVFTGSETINVKVKEQDDSISKDTDIAQNGEGSFQLLSTDVKLVITAPAGMDIRDCLLKVKTDVDLDVVHSRTDSNWTFKIIPNSLPPDQPTTVGVSVGQGEPD